MIVIDCQQGSEEWWTARLGIATASMFDKVLTPARMEPSQQAYGYQCKLLAEWLRGKPDDTFQSDWMSRGHELEPAALEAYSFITDSSVQRVGFCLEDEKRYGASPDALVDEDGAAEIKSPSPGVHVGYLIDGKIPTTYRMQCLGVLLVTGRAWIDFMSYHPDMDPLIVRMYASEEKGNLDTLHNALVAFHGNLETRKQYLIEQGYRPLEKAA